MTLAKRLTPENTEEVKPGVFLQKRYGKRGKESYKQIYPAAWNGKINWKNLILGGPNFWKILFWFVIIMFLVFAYVHDTKELREFHDKVQDNKLAWCAGVPFEELESNKGESDNETKRNTFTLQNNYG